MLSVSLQENSIRSARFRKEREATWKRLDAYVTSVEKKGFSSLTFDEVSDLTDAYRQTVNSLSAARAISMDKALLTYLEALSTRAYLLIYAPQDRLGGKFAKLLIYDIPQAVRASVWPILIGFSSIILGFILGYYLFWVDNSWFYTFVPGGLAGGRSPGASPEYLHSTLFQGERIFNPLKDGWDTAFASFLFSHNVRVTFLVFALGVFAILPSFILSLYNGLVLGAFFALFADAGLSYEVFGWLSIHGVTELSAICIGCAGGAQLGLAVVAPGNLSMKEALRQRSFAATKLVVLAIIMLLVAAVLEGFFRDAVQSTEVRLAVGWGFGLFWVLWLGLSGRKPRS